MPLCEHRATDLRRHTKSKLGESLLRLQQNLNQTRTTAKAAEGEFQQWQERWSDRREQISRRLELIDRQLESLLKDQEPRPQLSVVAAHPHEDGAPHDAAP